MKKWIFTLWLFGFFSVVNFAQDPGSFIAVNCNRAGDADSFFIIRNIAKLNMAHDYGLGWARCNGGPEQWYVDGKPSPERFSRVINKANKLGIKVYLFIEYRADIQGGSMQDYNWFEVGAKFAAYYGHKVACYGILNEIDHLHSPHSPDEIYQTVKAFADGVHSIDKDLRVISPSMGGTPMDTLHSIPYFHKMGELVNNGTIQILNLHSYHDCRDIPHYSCFDFEENVAWRPSQNFIRAKRVAGIKTNIQFAAGEFNYRNWKGSTEENGIGIMTTLWDQLFVVGKNGIDDRKLVFALPYNLHITEQKRATSMALEFNWSENGESYSYIPNIKGQVLIEVVKLSQGMQFIHTDPLKKGIAILKGSGKKMWVWHNRKFFSELYGQANIKISGIPKNATELSIYRWDSKVGQPFKTISLHQQVDIKLAVKDLPLDQTFMIVVNSDADNGIVGGVY